MAITPSIKAQRGLGLQPISVFQKVDEGWSPSLALQAATYLPVMRQDERFNEYYVLQAGQIAARDAVGTVVNANSGSASVVTYAAADIGYTVDIDGAALDAGGDLVTAAGAAATALAANRPIGWLPQHVYSGAIRLTRTNYELQPHIALINRGHIEMPLTFTAQNTIDEGMLLMPNATGWPVRWTHGVDPVDQIVGRVLLRNAITIHPDVLDNVGLVRTVKGFALPGTETAGQPEHLYAKTHEGGGLATDYVRVNITLMG